MEVKWPELRHSAISRFGIVLILLLVEGTEPRIKLIATNWPQK